MATKFIDLSKISSLLSPVKTYTDTKLALKQDKLTAQTGITISSDNKIGHTNSITANTTNVPSSTTKLPVIKNDAQGHLTYVGTADNNSTGTANSTSKLFLTGSTSQAASAVTYSNVNVFTSNGSITANSYNIGTTCSIVLDTSNQTVNFVFN